MLLQVPINIGDNTLLCLTPNNNLMYVILCKTLFARPAIKYFNKEDEEINELEAEKLLNSLSKYPSTGITVIKKRTDSILTDTEIISSLDLYTTDNLQKTELFSSKMIIEEEEEIVPFSENLVANIISEPEVDAESDGDSTIRLFDAVEIEDSDDNTLNND